MFQCASDGDVCVCGDTERRRTTTSGGGSEAGTDNNSASGFREQREFGERTLASPAIALARALHPDKVRALGFVRGAVQCFACGGGASYASGTME